MATYAIGDIQGCYQTLQALLEQLALQPADRIWLCGDLVNRGPSSAEVLRWAMRQGDSLVTVLGNHDLHLLTAAAGARALKRRDSFQDILEAEDRETLLQWLRTRPFLHRENGHVLVHAGLHPSWTIEIACELARDCSRLMQSDSWLDAWMASRPAPPIWSAELVGRERLASALSVFVGVRTLDANHRLDTHFAGAPDQRAPGTEPWFLGREDSETIVFGHWAALGLHIEERLIGIDTGCVWGGALTAIRLEDRKIYTQPALTSGDRVQ